MAYLKWIDDDALTKCVIDLINTAQTVKQKASASLNKNVMDPFSAMFQMAGFEMDYSTWMQSEEARQAQKSLQNHIGTFHQNILGSVKNWEDLGVGNVLDLRCSSLKIVAEVKNKWSTVSGGKQKDVYDTLHGSVMPKTSLYKGYTAYYVKIIPKKPVRYNIPFTPSDNSIGGKKPVNSKIREIDGASFYELVTGEKSAIFDLFEVIPKVITHQMQIKLSKDDLKNLNALFKAAFS